jgi:valyl-tRNA synthetase
MDMEKEYRPTDVERRWCARWDEDGVFRADPDSGRDPFCMVIPPPNITGNLHIGHVLVYTLHDIIARWRRMQGRDVLWLPGTDHAGIATQMVVERQLKADGLSRHEIGREAFEAKVWEWKQTYGSNITSALRDLGSSVDWSRERFTLDEGLSHAVKTVFVRLYKDGLIYRDRYIVNWCPRCETAISDLETESKTVQGKLYTIRYPSTSASEYDIRVATTRPETLLGDTAIAVNPDDERFAAFVGKQVRVPLTERDVTIVADTFVDIEFGTGAVKVTPAHDPNDFAAGRRLGLEERVVIDNCGKMTEATGPAYSGLDRFEARKKVVNDLKQQGLLLDVKAHEHSVGHCQRCGTMIEPLLSTQWFVKIQPLADRAISAVEDGDIRFVPASWSKTYFEWMRNIHDWCISRQLWWGHRIPAWYCNSCDETIVAIDEPESCTCGAELTQDPDVLDTWFSSALWPFSTLGWPDDTQDLSRYYPTDLLITGFDIIFFWVARMIMLGLEFKQEIPFKEVYIHGLVRDSAGQKMSKSKGNTVDPAEVRERYGTDAVRFTMAILAAPGNDIPLAPERMEGYRAFANKLWNACRFVLMKLDRSVPQEFSAEPLTLEDRWILSRTQATTQEVTDLLERYRFDLAADALYHFVWHQFCDWYIELVKPAFPMRGDDDESTPLPRQQNAQAVLLEVLGSLLKLLHPFMPFITEELWHTVWDDRGYLALAEWPVVDKRYIDAEAEQQMAYIQELVVKIRHLRAESKIDPARKIEVLLQVSQAADVTLFEKQCALIASLVRAESVTLNTEIGVDTVAARGVVRDIQIAIPLEGLFDLEAARDRVRKDLEKVAHELQSRNRKLNNASFISRAPAEIVDRERQIRDDLLEKQTKLEQNLEMFGG